MTRGKTSKMGVGDMKTVGTFHRIACLCICLFIFLGSLSQVQSQDLFRDMDQVKRDLSSLRNEVDQLKSSVQSLRKMVLEGVTRPNVEQRERMPAEEENTPKQEPVVDANEATRVACQAVGKFFEEVDATVRASNKNEASARMSEAMRRLHSSLHKYAGTHKVAKLLNICDSVSYDISLAKEMRGWIRGSQEFIDALNKHKREYRQTCEQ